MGKISVEFLKILSEAPERQLDKTMAKYAKHLIGKPIDEVRNGLKYILDISEHGGLASTFTRMEIEREWKRLGGIDT